MDVTPGLRRVPPPDLGSVGQDEDLAARIRDEIRRDGPMTFARFMALALYDPDGGYYRSDEARPGRAGDFLTAPETHPIFGTTLSRFVDDVWQRLDRPDRFVIREHGAGDGALAIALLTGLRTARSGLAEVIRYQPVEVDPRRIAAFEYNVSGAGFGAVVQAADDAPFSGLLLANEVADALPVHRVVQRGAELLEVRVGLDGTRFVDVETAPSTPGLFVRLAAEGVTLADGQRGEICLALDGWLRDATAPLARGIALLIDYGYPATELYDQSRRRDGTLRAYVRHTVHDDPYIHVGRQDLTAHVDVDAVVRAASDAGLTHLGTTTQAEFLVGLGMDEHLRAIQTDPATTMEAYLAVRSSVMRLLDPAATGRFRVMAFGREWPSARDGPEDRPLAGFGYRARWR